MHRKRSISVGVVGTVLAAASVSLTGSGTAQAASGLGNVVNHANAPTPQLIIRPAPWRETNETNVKAAVDAAAKAKLNKAGWRTVAIDDDWMVRTDGKDWDGKVIVPPDQHGRDKKGKLIVSPSKYPHGIQSLIDYVHAKGFRFGIYEDAGTATCDTGAGSWGHFQSDMNQFAAWKVDYVKLDNCYEPKPPTGKTSADQTVDAVRQAGTALERANQKYGTKMVMTTTAPGVGGFGDPVGNADYRKIVEEASDPAAHQWRATFDIGDSSWAHVLYALDSYNKVRDLAKPGHFPDLDRIFANAPGVTDAQAEAQFTMWAMVGSPMVVKTPASGEMFSFQALNILKNRKVLALNKDTLAAPALKVAGDANAEVYVKPLSDGDFAVALLNRSSSTQTIPTSAAQLGTSATSFNLTNLWGSDAPPIGADGSFSVSVPATSVAAFRLHPSSKGEFSGWSFGASGSRALNASAFTDDDAPTSGAVDAAGTSLSTDSLAAAGVTSGSTTTADGMDFTWPTLGSGKLDSVKATGQTIAFNHKTSKIGFLGVAGGADTAGTLTLHYSDGTSTKVKGFGLPSWQTKNPTAFGARTAVKMKGHNTQAGHVSTGTSRISEISVPVDPTKSLTAITLPNKPSLRFIASAYE